MEGRTKKEALMTTAILLVVGAILFISSTFAWLGVSRIPFVSEIGVSVTTDAALLLAKDDNGRPGEWTDKLDLSADFNQFAPLKPVTYTDVGLKPGLHKAQSWGKVTYDETGRTAGLIPLEDKNMNVHKVDDNSSSAKRAEAEEQGYMYMIEFWMRCQGGAGDVYLAEATNTADGQMGPGTYVVGKPEWNKTTLKHENKGFGSEYSLRFAFECMPYSEDENGELIADGDNTFTVYEPNANFSEDGKTYTGIYEVSKESDEKGKEHNVVVVPMNGATGVQKKVIVQHESTWEDENPALEKEVLYKPGQFYTNECLCNAKNEQYIKVRLFVWMDGEDPECLAKHVAEEVSAIANFQFCVQGGEMNTGIERR